MSTSFVFDPATVPNDFKNMTSGYIYHTKKKVNTLAQHHKNHKHLRWMHGLVGASGIYSSIKDMEKWKNALKQNSLISEKSKNIMFTPDKVSRKYGYGFAIYYTKRGRWVYHTGSFGGYKTTALYLPDTEQYLIILSNNRYKETYKSFDEGLYRLVSR